MSDLFEHPGRINNIRMCLCTNKSLSYQIPIEYDFFVNFNWKSCGLKLYEKEEEKA